jgi:hypothetical protein
MYEIWATQGQGGIKIHETETLEEALKYILSHKGEASFAIKLPDGRWHKW